MKTLAAVAVFALACSAFAADKSAPTFKTLQISDKFYCEGATYGDFNKDGKQDIASGPFWYEGPDFTKKHPIYAPTGQHEAGSYKADGEYSDNFLAFSYDFNSDDYPDLLVYGFPGKEAWIFENPGKQVNEAKEWKRHTVFDVVDNESPGFADITGDGKPDGIFHSGGYLGYATIDWSNPFKKWTFHPISPKGGWQRFTHGYGYGDINGDGRTDILESKGWWEQPADKNAKQWTRHPANFYSKGFGDGGSQMYAYDVDGDGKNDVICSLQAHGCGLAWFRQTKGDDGQIAFERNILLSDKYEANEQGVKFSQLHALALADMNGDGLLDIVTGKRYYAHHATGDVAPQDPPVLYWFELKRENGKATYTAHQLHDNSGVGTQVTVGDINGDKTPDIVVGNKKGTFVTLSQTSESGKTASAH